MLKVVTKHRVKTVTQHIQASVMGKSSYQREFNPKRWLLCTTKISKSSYENNCKSNSQTRANTVPSLQHLLFYCDLIVDKLAARSDMNYFKLIIFAPGTYKDHLT